MWNIILKVVIMVYPVLQFLNFLPDICIFKSCKNTCLEAWMFSLTFEDDIQKSSLKYNFRMLIYISFKSVCITLRVTVDYYCFKQWLGAKLVKWRRHDIDMMQNVKITMVIFFLELDHRTDSWLAPSQWETALLCNDVSHWLGAKLKSAQNYTDKLLLT